MDILLLHPPAAKASEPPLGTAILLGHLRQAGYSAGALDANLEAYLYLLDPERLQRAAGAAPAPGLRRAMRNAPRALQLLRSAAAGDSFARYSAAVHHLNQSLQAYSGLGPERLTLGDYSHGGLSEFSPEDLERLSAGALSTLFADYFRSRLLPRIAALAPRLLAISVNYRHQILPAFELAGLLRRALPELTLVGGGGIFSTWRSELQSRELRFSAFDHIVFGPGEGPLTALAAGGDGGYFLEGSDSVAFRPDYSFAAVGDYLSPRPVLQVSASRGCYWRRCQFCPEAATPTHPYSSLAPAEFPPLLRSLQREHGVEHFHLTDNAIPVPVLKALAAAPRENPPLSWHGFVRFEPALLDAELVAGLAAGGCRMLQLGLESGSQTLLDRIGKGTRLEEVAQILANLQRAGIASYVYVMLGVPGESAADAEQTLAFLETHADSIGFLNLAIMNLPRESELLTAPQTAGIAALAPLPEGEPLGLYRSFTPVGEWGRSEARRFLQQRLLASAAIRAIVQRTPPLFTSNHAFLFGVKTVEKL